MATYLGIEIGGTKLQIVAGDENAVIKQRFRFRVHPEEGADGIRKHIAETIEQLYELKPAGIGVGFGGPVNRITGKIWTSYHVNGWSDFSLVKWLGALTEAPVFIDNDANVAAMGEALHGAGRNNQNIFYLTLGSGAGGGLVVDGKIYHGALPGETEIGHIRLDKTGRTFQSSCSGWAVDEKIRKFAKKNSSGVLAALTKGLSSGEAGILANALSQNDTDAKSIFDETTDDLALGLSHVVHLFHPEIIILGGGLSLIGEPLRQLVESNISRYIMNAFQPGPLIRLSALKEDAVPVGALTLAITSSKK